MAADIIVAALGAVFAVLVALNVVVVGAKLLHNDVLASRLQAQVAPFVFLFRLGGSDRTGGHDRRWV